MSLLEIRLHWVLLMCILFQIPHINIRESGVLVSFFLSDGAERRLQFLRGSCHANLVTLNALSILRLPRVNRVKDNLIAFLASIAGRQPNFLMVVSQFAREVHEASAHALIDAYLVEH